MCIVRREENEIVEEVGMFSDKMNVGQRRNMSEKECAVLRGTRKRVECIIERRQGLKATNPTYAG